MSAKLIITIPQVVAEYSIPQPPLVIKEVDVDGYKSGKFVGLFLDENDYPEFVISKANLILISKQFELLDINQE